jgi:polysaccharide biosynthesis protein PelC
MDRRSMMSTFMKNDEENRQFPHVLRAKFAINLVVISAFLMACAGLGGCAAVQSTPPVQGEKGPVATLAATDSVALLPISNFTDVPQAGLRAESIVEASLRAKGLRALQVYPPALNPETLFEPSERKAQAEAEKWAQSQKIRYAMSGTVTEWRYKVGVDGEPAVGLTLQLKDLSTGQVVWSGSGGKSGWSREALSAVAQKLTRDLLATLILQTETKAK